MIEASLDLETLSIEPNAAVVSIGLVIFEGNNILADYEWNMDPDYWIGDIDNHTIAWWMKQSQSARSSTFSGKCESGWAAEQLSKVCEMHSPKTVWANDPDFDLVVLKSWWLNPNVRSHGIEFPFGFRQYRSMRTIKDLATRAGFVYSPDRAAVTTAHRAVDDALWQARYIMAATEFLTKKGI